VGSNPTGPAIFRRHGILVRFLKGLSVWGTAKGGISRFLEVT